MKTPGCRNVFLYDCNPGSPLHWTYKIFVRKIDFKTEEPLNKPELYVSMLINPIDNMDHLDSGYIEDVLDNLPEKQKAYFLSGLWVKGEGYIYERFEREMIMAGHNITTRSFNDQLTKQGWFDDDMPGWRRTHPGDNRRPEGQ